MLKQRSSSAASEMLENDCEPGEEGAPVAFILLAGSWELRSMHSPVRVEFLAVDVDSVESAMEEPIPLSDE